MTQPADEINDSARERWVLWRQDDHGNAEPMQTFESEEEALAMQKLYEDRGHKQMYWVKGSPACLLGVVMGLLIVLLTPMRLHAESGGPFYFLPEISAEDRATLAAPPGKIPSQESQILSFYQENFPERIPPREGKEEGGIRWKSRADDADTTVRVGYLGRIDQMRVRGIRYYRAGSAKGRRQSRAPVAALLAVETETGKYAPRFVMFPGTAGPQEVQFSLLFDIEKRPGVVLTSSYHQDRSVEILYPTTGSLAIAYPRAALAEGLEKITGYHTTSDFFRRHWFNPFRMEWHLTDLRLGKTSPERTSAVIKVQRDGDRITYQSHRILTPAESEYIEKDYTLNLVYQRLRLRVSPVESRALFNKQTDWLELRDKRCGDSDDDSDEKWKCLKMMTSLRIEELRAMMPEGTDD